MRRVKSVPLKDGLILVEKTMTGIPFNEKAYSKVKELIEKGEPFKNEEIAKRVNVHPRTVITYKRKAEKELGITRVERRVGKKDRRKPKAVKGGTLDDFRDQFDDSVVIPTAIEKGIKNHLMRPDGTPLYMRDSEFREACDVPPGKWRRYAEDYKHLQVKKDGVTYWGHPDIVEGMRKAVNR